MAGRKVTLGLVKHIEGKGEPFGVSRRRRVEAVQKLVEAGRAAAAARSAEGRAFLRAGGTDGEVYTECIRTDLAEALGFATARRATDAADAAVTRPVAPTYVPYVFPADAGDDAAAVALCSVCKSTNIDITQRQTRGADEPMTVFCCCLDCGKRWRQ